MAWLSSTTHASSDTPVLATVLNNIGLDIRTAGANHDMAGYSITNCASISGPVSGRVGFGVSAGLSARVQVHETTTDAPLLRVHQMKNNGGSAGVVEIADDRAFGGANTGDTVRITSWTSFSGSTGALLNVGSGNGSFVSLFRVGMDGCTAIQGAKYAAPATSGSASADQNLRVGASGHGEVLDIGTGGGAGTWIQCRSVVNYASNFSISLNPNGGNVGIGTLVPTAKLQVVGLDTHASNAAAVSAGKTAGAFYTDGAGNVKVVY